MVGRTTQPPANASIANPRPSPSPFRISSSIFASDSTCAEEAGPTTLPTQPRDRCQPTRLSTCSGSGVINGTSSCRENSNWLRSPDAPVISIGKKVERFLTAKNLENHLGSIVHFSKSNGRAQKQLAEEQPDAYGTFRSTVNASDLEQTVRNVLKGEPNAPSV